MKSILNESFDVGDLENILLPVVTVDEYEAKMGENSDIVTLTFIIKSEQAGDDLVSWFEKGYDFVLDAKVSEGEVSPGKYLVFVEMNRRTTVPEKIVELITDLKTLTNLDNDDWVVKVDDKKYPVDSDALKKVIILSPAEYKKQKENEEELNEMRNIAGLSHKKIFKEDYDIKNIKTIAGV